MGDLSAHSRDARHIHPLGVHILDYLGWGLDEVVSSGLILLPMSTMDGSVDDMGWLLVSHYCSLDSGLFCFLASPMHDDTSGRYTHAHSVADYGLVEALM